MNISEVFGSKVFNDNVMRARLPASVYKSLKATSRLGYPLDPEIADVVATAMKDWAISQGATHYTHWFQPLNNISAGKHDSFLNMEEGVALSAFSSSALVRGEPDASSFPSGGLRATFEARGYTSWDPTSPAFVRDGTLYIPTAFSSYTGEALDAKTPLLRSMQALNPQALRILRALGNTTTRVVTPTVGAEQEYFLVDRALYEKRLDLKLCGCTLLGAKPPKGQELDDHYCGRIRMRVAQFMKELDEQLWALGIPSQTKHNEVAPGQHELAPIYETDNIACDHNLLIMDVMRVTAKKLGLACLLHEKPFAGVNGSGKHNNFSISTDDGINFLSPGTHPEENKLFLLTLCGLIETVDRYSDLLRLSAATPGNDMRLGGCEAPPAIISLFLGENLSQILFSIARGISPEVFCPSAINDDIDILPSLQKDDSDRNRTSPFAFTGNKFEFRMLGSSQSVAFCNTVLNTAMADVFSRFADRLEACDDVEHEVAHIIADTCKKHGRIIFNGNNYSEEWIQESKRRGLPALSTLEAIDCLLHQKNSQLFCQHSVLCETELHARHEILLENYIKVVGVEAETMLHMVRRQIFPAAVEYAGQIARNINSIEATGLQNHALRSHLQKVNDLIEKMDTACEQLWISCHETTPEQSIRKQADFIQDSVRPQMQVLRTHCDALELIMDAKLWPIPTYTDLMHRM